MYRDESKDHMRSKEKGRTREENKNEEGQQEKK